VKKTGMASRVQKPQLRA